jgi:hypothetical protein
MKKLKAISYNILLIATTPFLLLINYTPVKAQASPTYTYTEQDNGNGQYTYTFTWDSQYGGDDDRLVFYSSDCSGNINPYNVSYPYGVTMLGCESGPFGTYNPYVFYNFDNLPSPYTVSFDTIEQSSTFTVYKALECGSDLNCLSSYLFTNVTPPPPPPNPDTGLFSLDNVGEMVTTFNAAIAGNAIPALLIFGATTGLTFILSKFRG